MVDDAFLSKRLLEREEEHALRSLKLPSGKIDFCSNDYLGIVKRRLTEKALLAEILPYASGSTGSRLLSGNSPLMELLEEELALFHEAPAALVFNSGYDANTGLLSAIPQRGDTILYDQLSHASIRDGVRLSVASAFSFQHNDLAHLEARLKRSIGQVFVVTESLFSMDGDMAPLVEVSRLCSQYGASLILDEAHATGVVGERGEGGAQETRVHESCFARIHTFGKACGVHGAVVLGSDRLKQYLINFCRQFIYTTALPEISVAAIRASYQVFPTMKAERSLLNRHIKRFQQADIRFQRLPSQTPIQVVIVPGNLEVKNLAAKLQAQNFDIRPILYPTVPKGQERLRVALHAFNTEEELNGLLDGLV